MSKYHCPHCQQPAFSIWDKYLAAKWKVLTCSHCGRRACSVPLLLAFFYLFYLMDVIDFTYMSVISDDMNWIIAAVVGWLILDLFSIYIPLVRMQGKGAQAGSSDIAST